MSIIRAFSVLALLLHPHPLYVYPFIYLTSLQSIFPSTGLSMRLSIHLVFKFVYLFIYTSIYTSVFTSVRIYILSPMKIYLPYR